MPSILDSAKSIRHLHQQNLIQTEKTIEDLIKLPPAIQDLEAPWASSSKYKDGIKISLEYYKPQEAEEAMNLLKEEGVSFIGKLQFRETLKVFELEGTLLCRGTLFYINLQGLPKPENCELIPEEKWVKETVWKAECREE